MLTNQVLDVNLQGENNLYNIDWAGSPYGAEVAGVTAVNLLRPPSFDTITGSYNQSFSNTKFLMALPKKACEEFKDVWYENTSPDIPIIVRGAGAAAVPNVGTSVVVQTIPITDASFDSVGLQHKLLYPSDDTRPITHGTVTARAGAPGARTIDVTSYVTEGLPAVAAGEVLGNSGPRQGDGQPLPPNTFRGTSVRFWNGMEELGGFGCRWDPKDSVRWDALSPDFKMNELREIKEKYYNAIQQTILVGKGLQTTLADGRRTNATYGIIPQLERANVGVTNVTAAGFVNVMRSAVHDLQVKDEENKWLLLAPGRVLDAIGHTEKAERVRYTIGDKTFDSKMTAYNYWGHTVIPVRLNAMQNIGMYGTSFANRAILIRESQLKLTYNKYWPMFASYHKLGNNQNVSPVSGFANIEAAWWSATFGVRVEMAWSAAMFNVII